MPDLDAELAALRDELRATVAVPDLATVVERSRQRVTRRRRQIGAVVAVLVVSALVPVLRQLEPAPSPATPPPSSSPAPGPQDYGIPYEMKFADADHGYALRTLCEDHGTYATVPPDCELKLYSTDDGENWEPVGRVPVRRTDLAGAALMSVLGPDELLIDWSVGGDPNSPRTFRMYSDDGGRTWREVAVPDVVTDTVPAIPQGAEIRRPCPTIESCTEPGVVVLLPGSGTSARLANPPDLTGHLIPGGVPTADGHWWVVGRRPGTGNWAVAVSTDDGRTWTTTDLGWRGGVNEWSVVSDGDTLYASAARIMGSDDDGLHGVFRSDDDGRTWTLTWQPSARLRLPWFAGTLVAGNDGSVSAGVYGQGGGSYVSTDGGRTFVRSDRNRATPVTWTRAGYLTWWDPRYEVSADGVNWRLVEMPRE